MQTCSTCQRPIEPGFDFCHVCGTPVHQPAVPAFSQEFSQSLTHLKDLAITASRVGSSWQSNIDTWLGSPISLKRQLLYTLVTSLALVLSAGISPLTAGLVGWLEQWLLMALVLVAPMSYWLTGIVPFSGVANALFGDITSLRRRLFLTLLLISPLQLMFLNLAAPAEQGKEIEALIASLVAGFPAFLGMFMIAFYMMGFVANWKFVSALRYGLSLEGMGELGDEVASAITKNVRARNIPGLEISEVAMSKLRRYTAGSVRSRRGSQIVLTREHIRVVIFVQDFGSSLAVRWSSFYNMSGRRLWLLIGLVVSLNNDFSERWLGFTVTDVFTRTGKILSPASRHQVLMDNQRATTLERMLGLQGDVSEYSWNDLNALDQVVRVTVVEVLRISSEQKYQKDEIERMIERHIDEERKAKA